MLDRLPGWVTLVRCAQPGADDAGRHQHLGAARGRASPRRSSSTPARSTRATSSAVAERRPIGLVLVTHGTPTTSKGCARFVELTERDRWSATRSSVAGLVGSPRSATPGHTADSVCFLVEADGERVIFTGDTILGRGTTVVASPDGDAGRLPRQPGAAHRVRPDPGAARPRPGAGRLRRGRPLLPRPPRARLDQVRDAARGRGEDAAGRGRRWSMRTWTDRCGRRPNGPSGRNSSIWVPVPGNLRACLRGWIDRDLSGVRNRRRTRCPLLPQLRSRAAGCGDAARRRAAGRHRTLRRPVRLHLLVGGSSIRNGSARSPTGCSPHWPARSRPSAGTSTS